MKVLAESLVGEPAERRSDFDGNILQMEDVTLNFGGVTALAGVSLHVADTELVAVIGPNGAGKTSVFNVLSGVYKPQDGRVTFLGENILGQPEHRIAAMGMARTFQNIELFDGLSVVENLLLGRHTALHYHFLSALFWTRTASTEEYRHRRLVEDIIEFLEIEEFRDQRVGELPYGIRKRIELGRALAMTPRLLLLDEPVAGMNVEETEDMVRFIVEVRRELRVPMLLVEHEMRVVMGLADRVVALDFGKVIAAGSPREVQSSPEVVRAYLGD